MASLGNGDLTIKTLGDLRKFVKIFDGESDDISLTFEDSIYDIIITNSIDISYSEQSATIYCLVDYINV